MEAKKQNNRVMVHIDPKGYSHKPSGAEVGAIKARLQKNANSSLITLEELAKKLETGHAISPGVMGGMSAKDWNEQQLFLVDIDNENDEPLLSVNRAKAICDKYDIEPVFYYKTFSHTKEKPKFRIAFVMDKPVTDEVTRKKVVTALVNLFPQSDKSCVNADRFFHGTNHHVVFINKNARISCEKIEPLLLTHFSERPQNEDARHSRGRHDTELDELVKNFDLFGYLKKRNGEYRRTEKGVVFCDCEICGHHDNLMYVFDTNTFSCRSKDVGGSIIDYLIHAEGLSKAEAIHKLKYELTMPEWKPPIPFDEVRLPRFPVDALPMPLCDWVKSVAKNTATPVDMPAVCALAVLSCALQGKYVVFAKEGYTEPLNLYILLIANSGERKSAVVRLMTEPIYRYEDRENERRKEIIAQEQNELEKLKGQISALKQNGKSEDAAELMKQCREMEKNPTKTLRMVADDVTPEALTSMLAENNGILTIISTEGGLFDTLAGRYSNTLSIDTILKAYSGDRIRVDRKGRESEVINNPALTMLLSVQSNVLDGLMQNAAFKSRGLTARILYSKPKSKIGTRTFDTPDYSQKLKVFYDKLIDGLLDISYDKIYSAKLIRLSEEAYQEVSNYFAWLEPQLTEELRNMDGWAEKAVGNTLRIAGLLHCVKHKNKADEKEISSDTVKQAIRISKYFLKHAQYSYLFMGADKTFHGAQRIIKKLQEQPQTELTKYQVYRLVRYEFSTVSEITPMIDLLVEHGYLREKKYDIPTGGRPRANGYLLNPLFFGKK